MDIKEAIKIFDIKDVNKTAAAFDLKKLVWVNNQYFKNKDPGELTDLLIPLLAQGNLIEPENFDRNYLVSLVKLFQSRLGVLNDFAERADFFFLKEPKMDEEAKRKYLQKDLSREFKLFIKKLEELKSFKPETIEEAFRSLIAELKIESKELIHPIRVALSGKTVGPGLFELIYYLGKEKTKERLSKFIH